MVMEKKSPLQLVRGMGLRNGRVFSFTTPQITVPTQRKKNIKGGFRNSPGRVPT